MSYAVAIVAHPDKRSHPEQSLHQGITTFNVRERAEPDQIVLEALGPLDLHHGEYSHNPPWDAVEVYGATPTAELRDVLQDMGVTEVSSIPGGFRATRSSRG